MALKLIVVLLFVCLCAKWSKCVSVEIPVKRNDPKMAIAIVLGAGENLENIESLAASKVLMDHTSAHQIPSVQMPLLKVNHSVFQTLLPSNAENKEYDVTTLSLVKKLNKNQDAAKNLRSPLDVPRCRAACLIKFTIYTHSNLENENQAENIKGSIGRVGTFTIPIKFSTGCPALTKCRSCRKSCKNIKPTYYYIGQDETSTVLATEATKQKNDGNSGEDVKRVIDDSESEKQHEKINPLNLRLKSLTHQKLLVIAELKWNEIGDNPKQEYQVTWELIGGGLKGHLVTDSTSVTLSLWPDTTYTIRVETFQQKSPDLDGKQLKSIDGRDPPASSKSLQLTVDTSEISLKKDELLNEEEYGKDEIVSEEDEQDTEKDELLGRKSFREVLGVLFASLLLVFVIFIVILFVLIKLRSLFTSKNENSEVEEDEESECFYNFFTRKRRDTRILACRDNINSDVFIVNFFYATVIYI